MCGIAGIISKNESGKGRVRMLNEGIQLLKHRGPDVQQCIMINDQVALAHARLSILDLSANSNQPFSLDQQNYLVFNGEIFNYQKLKEEKFKELPFKTTSDTELVYQSFIREGENALSDFIGFYALALYNLNENSLLLAVDRIGVKPLYYLDHPDFFAFASELKPLIHLLGNIKLEHNALPPFLALTYSAGEMTLVSGVKCLLPGQLLKWKNNDWTIAQHLSLNTKPKPKVDFRELFEDAVRLRLVSDVPVGSFLSGGIDSTIVTAVSSKLNPGMKTFSLGFKNQKFFDESSLARQTAEVLKTEHHELLLDEEDLLNKINPFLDHLDVPFADSSALNVFALSEFAAKQVRVVLSGDGADEVFGGYNKHKAWHYMHSRGAFNLSVRLLRPFLGSNSGSRNSRFGNYARQIRKYHDSLMLNPAERYWKLACWTQEEDVYKLLKKEQLNTNYLESLKSNYLSEVNESLQSVFLTDSRFVLPFDMLVKVDRMSMAHGLEVRSPFLDYRIIEQGLSLPSNSKIIGKQQKVFLKKTFHDLIPDFILHQPKRGFEIPLENWLKGPLRKRLDEDWFNLDFIEHQGIFNVQEVKGLIRQLDHSKTGENIYTIWAMLVFNHWWKRNFK